MTYEDATEEALSISEEVALGLSRAAVMLDRAKQNRADKAALATALNHNLELWVAIQGIVARRDNDLPEKVKDNLVSLGNYVADTTFKNTDGLKYETIDTLINVNLRISEGLLEGQAAT